MNILIKHILSQSPEFLTGQVIGIVALIIAIISFQCKTTKKIIIFQLLGSVLFTVHFYLIGAYVGALLNFIGIFRCAVFYNKNKAWAKNKLWLYFFVIISIVVGIFTCDGDINFTSFNINFSSIGTYIGIFPVIAVSLLTFAFWEDDASNTRKISAFASPCWIIYNLYNLSFAGILTELFVFMSIIIAMIRYDFCKKMIISIKKNKFNV